MTNQKHPAPPSPVDLFQPLLFNTLQVRSALGAAQRRKLSFKNVSNVVVQLLHSIKYSMEVPFSNMAMQPDPKNTNSRKVSFNFKFIRFVSCVPKIFIIHSRIEVWITLRMVTWTKHTENCNRKDWESTWQYCKYLYLAVLSMIPFFRLNRRFFWIRTI